VRIKLTTLGRVRCDLDDHNVTDLPAQRIRCALFIYLAVERKSSRETIQNLFWSNRNDERGRGTLKWTVYSLRRRLGEDCIESLGEELRVASSVTTDLRDFEDRVQAKDWEAALSLYTGCFLQGFWLPNCKPFEFWVDRQRAHAARLHCAARRARIAELLAVGETSSALSVARRWAQLEPLEDEAQHRLIEFLATSGERAEALRVAENYERMLLAEGLKPLDETNQLVERIRAGEAIVLARVHRETADGTGAPPGRLKSVTPASRAPYVRPPRNSGSNVRRLLALTAVLLATAGVWWGWVVVRPGPQARHVRAIAALPFENRSQNREQTEYLSDGLTDDLINALSHIVGIQVSSFTSSFAFKNTSYDITEIGRKLGVDAILKGTLRLDGATVRVTAQLIDAKNGYNLWFDVYDRELSETLVVQDEIVRDIVQALATQLGKSDAAQLATRRRTNPQAYNEYLMGRHFWSRRTNDGVLRAVRYFEAAIRLDPKYALAFSGLADAYITIQARGISPRMQACAKAKQAALAALALDSALAEVRTSMALVHWNCDDRPDAAEREFRRAIAINQNLAVAHAWYGTMLSAVLGRFPEGLRESRIARRLDPLSTQVLTHAGTTFRAAGQHDSAVSFLKMAREIEPTAAEFTLAKTYLEMGLWREAGALLDSAIAAGRNQRQALGYRAYIYARSGRPELALEILQKLENPDNQENAWDAIAIVHLGLGDESRALVALEKAALDRPSFFLILLATDPILTPLRDHPRFDRMLRQLQLPRIPSLARRQPSREFR
jgi:TolB-like protein/DNA-binding SARP family transcriptional activator/Tfp pilus assembly protein PilF